MPIIIYMSNIVSIRSNIHAIWWGMLGLGRCNVMGRMKKCMLTACMYCACCIHVSYMLEYIQCMLNMLRCVHICGVHVQRYVHARVCQLYVQQGGFINCCISPITQHIFIQIPSLESFIFCWNANTSNHLCTPRAGRSSAHICIHKFSIVWVWIW